MAPRSFSSSNLKVRSLDGMYKLLPETRSEHEPMQRIPSLLALADRKTKWRFQLAIVLLLTALSILCVVNIVSTGKVWLESHNKPSNPQSIIATVQVQQANSNATTGQRQPSTYIINATVVEHGQEDTVMASKLQAAAGVAALQDKLDHQSTPTSGDHAVDVSQKKVSNATKEEEEKEEKIKQESPKLAELHLIQVMNQSTDACAAKLQHPKVALLFMTKGRLFHEESWKVWFQSAQNRLPIKAFTSAFNGTLCTVNTSQYTTTRTGDTDRDTGIGSLIDMQHLFNVYVHAPPAVQPEEVGELFSNHLIQHRITPEWGSHSLTYATRNLIWEAFRDPSNQRFILLSESDVPLYDPLTVYRQLISETKSRVNAHPHDNNDLRRWSFRMAQDANINYKDWRKSSQWFSLLRKHAQLVLEDEAVFRAFEKHCKNFWDEDYNKWRDCFSDEHYIPTLLSVRGVANETVDRMSGVSASDWSRGGAHPYSYQPNDINAVLFKDVLRNSGEQCTDNRTNVQEAAANTFFSLDGDISPQETASVLSKNTAGVKFEALPGTCMLMARKFGEDTAERVFNDVFMDCSDGGAGLIQNDVCRKIKDEKIGNKLKINWRVDGWRW